MLNDVAITAPVNAVIAKRLKHNLSYRRKFAKLRLEHAQNDEPLILIPV